MIVVIVFGVFV